MFELIIAFVAGGAVGAAAVILWLGWGGWT